MKRIGYALAALAAVVVLTAQSYSGGNVIANNYQLANLPNPNPGVVYTRLGYAQLGDAPAQDYTLQTGQCSAADNGAQVQWVSQGVPQNGCFVAVIPSAGMDAREWGAKFNGSSDDTAGLQAAFNWLSATNGRQLIMPQGTAVFKSDLTIGAAQNYTLTGSGTGSTRLLYEGSSQSGNLVSFGTHGTVSSAVTIKDFWIASNTTMTSGWGLYAVDFTHSYFTNVEVSDSHLYNDEWFNGFGWVVLDHVDAFGQQDGIDITGDGSGLQSDFWIMSGIIAENPHIGVHIEGGAAGVNIVAADILGNGNGVVQDNSVNSGPNGQLTLGPLAQVDSSGAFGVEINNTVGPSLGYQQMLMGWVASSGGDNIYIPSCPNCMVQIAGQVLGSQNNGVEVTDATATYYLTGGMIEGNTHWGFYCNTAATKVYVNNVVANNPSGEIGTNCTQETIN